MLEMTNKQFRKEHPTMSYVADLFIRHKHDKKTYLIDKFAEAGMAIYCYKVPVITTFTELAKSRYIMAQLVLVNANGGISYLHKVNYDAQGWNNLHFVTNPCNLEDNLQIIKDIHNESPDLIKIVPENAILL